MRKATPTPVTGIAVGLALLLAGCGDSHPISAPSSSGVVAAPAGSAAAAYVPAKGAFAVVTPDMLPRSYEPSGKCNLDAIDGAPVGSKPLPRDSSVLFAGWAGANDGSAVPTEVTIVLHGAQNFAIRASTGAPRPDVAAANHMPALANSGYAINASMAAVSSGSYGVELHFKAGGKAWRCESKHAVMVN